MPVRQLNTECFGRQQINSKRMKSAGRSREVGDSAVVRGAARSSVLARAPDTHSLRAADSLKLVAPLIRRELPPSKRGFICRDYRLAEAAESAGFSDLELPKAVS
jgi:hypothetical protein